MVPIGKFWLKHLKINLKNLKINLKNKKVWMQTNSLKSIKIGVVTSKVCCYNTTYLGKSLFFIPIFKKNMQKNINYLQNKVIE